MAEDLFDKLYNYSSDDYVPMHMPGAKRNAEICHMCNPYEIDITEIDGFDNLHNATGILKESFDKCADLFGSDQALYLINGSSAGILAAICGTTKKREKILVARNCHKSVYNAIYLNELNPVYVYPDLIKEEDTWGLKPGIYGAVTLENIKEKIKENPDINVVVVTSPTYEGIVSDIEKIADYLHRKDKILIVDEAHGAHFNFHNAFPKSAVECGADLVIQSIHKTLPAFTQTALLHFNGDRVNRERVEMYWNIFQTTSPSYILMAGIDRCMTILQNDGENLFNTYVKRLTDLRNELTKLKNIKLLKVDDISKIVLLVSDGKKLYDILLKKYHIQLEMASFKYVIAMTSVCDTDEYYDRFLKALQEIDNSWSNDNSMESDIDLCRAEVVLNPFDAINAYDLKKNTGKSDKNACKFDIESCEINKTGCKSDTNNTNCNDNHNDLCVEEVNLEYAKGRIAAENVCFYPPGIALINPGERISEDIIKEIKTGIKSGLSVLGLKILNNQNCGINNQNGVINNQNDGINDHKVEKEVYIKCLK